ncbi:MAG: response regulator transcription factor [Bacteroidetes bacterium]|nr:response regulator transcription factor [Bacteroidota bacterium]
MTAKIKIAIIDDHKIVREGLKSMLMGINDFEIIAEGGNEADLLEILKNHIPSVIIMDISMPGKSGIELTSHVTDNYADIKVLILTTCCDEDSVVDSMEAGAHGFLHKECTLQELENAIKSVNAGEGYFSENITGIIYKSYITRIRSDKAYKQDPKKALSEREVEVIKMFSEGLSYKEIADRMNLSTKTVEAHKANILKKLDLHNIIDLVKYAIKHKIIRL